MNAKQTRYTRRQPGPAAVACLLGLLWAGALPVVGAALAGEAATGPAPEPAAAGQRVITVDSSRWSVPAQREDRAPANRDRLQREGLVIDFRASSLATPRRPSEIWEGDEVEISLRIQDDRGDPIRGIYPALWVDYDGVGQQAGMECKQRVGAYLAGNVGIRPLVDLNSYYVVVMNREPSLFVIDPIIGISGRTKLYARIDLAQPGGDWAATADGKRLFVSMPKANQVALIDTEGFRLLRNLDAGPGPLRVALQPDEQYLWVGNDGDGADSGVTVIDTRTLETVATLATGAGHHEIAFSTDGDKAYVSNRDGGTVTVFDTRTLQPVADLAIDGVPISLAYSSLADALYVVDAQTGEVVVFDSRQRPLQRIQARPGLGPLRFSPDGRWGVLTNPFQDRVSIIDVATNAIVHDLTVEGQPYQVSFSRAFAYIRSLASERVTMLELQHFDGDSVPEVSFAAGARAPGRVADPSIASQIVEAPGEAAVVLVSPADATVYYYMEGMNAPMGNFRNYGQIPRAVTVVDRSLKEVEPGLYQGRMRIPAAGNYQVAMVMESPQVLHCFEMVAAADPERPPAGDELTVKYLNPSLRVKAGEPLELRFRLEDSLSQQPRSDLKQVQVLYYRAPGAQRQVVTAQPQGSGVYSVDLRLARRGAYYIHVGVPEKQLEFGELPYRTLIAR